MKKTKSLVAAFAALTIAVPAFADFSLVTKDESYVMDGMHYYRYVVKGYTGTCPATLEMPEEYSYIDDDAFSGCKTLKNLVFNGWASLGENAFDKCSALETVTFKSASAVGYRAFYACKALKSVTFGGDVLALGEKAFEGCSSLVSIKFAGDAPSQVESAPFKGVPSSCMVSVQRGSKGWNVAIPGTWKGLRIAYAGEEGASGGGSVPAQAAYVQTAAAVYDGWLSDASGAVVGTVMAKVAKPRNGAAAVTVTLQQASKTRVKGTLNTNTGALVSGNLSLAFYGDEMDGTFGAYTVCGVRNLFQSKNAAEKAAAAKTLADLQAKGAITAAMRVSGADGDGFVTVSLSLASKGKVKVAGTHLNGSKLSGSAQLILTEGDAKIPVFLAKKANIAMLVDMNRDGSQMEIDGLSDGAAGFAPRDAASKLYVFVLDDTLAAPGMTTLDEFLPWYVVSGSGWAAPSAGKIKIVGGHAVDTTGGDNSAGLKLKYNARTGVFTGSFKVYGLAGGRLKKKSATVSGVLMKEYYNGAVHYNGYGTASIKNTSAAPVYLGVGDTCVSCTD